jgi:hypothetical protein
MNKVKKIRKESIFVRVPAPDNTADFHDITHLIGKPMPFSNPKATCGMRVSSNSVVFSLLHLTKRAVSGLTKKSVESPRGPLARLERIAADYKDLAVGSLVAIYDEKVYNFVMEKDSNGVLDLSSPDSDFIFDLPKQAVQISLIFKSPNTGRIIVVGFIGHLGKPGNNDSVRRVSSMVLFSLSQLLQFRLLADIETVSVPNPPRAGFKPFARKESDKVQDVIPVWFFDETSQPNLLTNGNLGVEIDLDQANLSTGRLLYKYIPDENLLPHFDNYKNILDSTISTIIKQKIGEEEIKSITVDIVLGEVSSGSIDLLREALKVLTAGLDLTPKLYQIHSAN